MRAKKYRKIVPIEAVRYSVAGGWRAEGFDDAVCHQTHATVRSVHIHTLEGPHLIDEGDWIVKGIKGEFWPIKDDIFRETYEELPTASMAVDSHDDAPWGPMKSEWVAPEVKLILGPHYDNR